MDESTTSPDDEKGQEKKKERKRDRLRRIFSRNKKSSGENEVGDSAESDTPKKFGKKPGSPRPANHKRKEKPLVDAETGEDTSSGTEEEKRKQEGSGKGKIGRFFRRRKKQSPTKKSEKSEDTEESEESSTATPVSSDDEEEGSGRVSKDESETGEDPSEMGTGKPLQEQDDATEELGVSIDKKQQFQIRVRVIEAKELEGVNINPVCRVFFGSKMRSTRIRYSTDSPKWDQSLFCSLKLSLAELAEKNLELKVYNARRMLKGPNLIGAFACNMGLVYRQKGHSIVNRWLALTKEVEHDSDVGVCGYLKVSVSVLGPGQKGLHLNVRSSPKDDVETNVLFGGAAQFRSVTLQIRILELLDLPILQERQSNWIFTKKERQMESYNFFVEVLVGGRSARTKLTSSAAAQVYQEIRIPIKWPTVASFILIRLFGSRRPREEIPLGNVRLRFRDICFPGMDGFLPCFGPSYLTFYGSDSPDTRERRDTNLGSCETSGNAYHGRILVQVNTLSEQTEADSRVAEVSASDMLRIQPQIRTMKHSLFCMFFAANMIAKEFKSENVNFEISIGAYGNGLYPVTAPSASKTTGYMPQYDSSTYYCMPWGSMKPCCVVPCSWELYDYRIRASNFLEEVSHRLRQGLDAIVRKIGCRNDDNLELASDIVDLLERTHESLENQENVLLKKADDFNSSVQTELDRKLQEIRRNQMEEIRREMWALRDRRIGVEDAVELIRGYANRMECLAGDPQISIPDISIWMLVNGERKAYARLPAKDFFYSPDEDGGCGKNAGNLTAIYLKWPSRKELKSHGDEIPALLHVKVFFATDSYRSLWENFLDTAKMKYFAETYENQAKSLGVWKPSPKRPPQFSDEEGKHHLPPSVFKPPPNWKFLDKDFKVSRIHDVWVDPEAGYERYEEELYEVHEKDDAEDEWLFLEWTDFFGNKSISSEKLECPAGWVWADQWRVDLNCPGDDEGFTYQTDNIFQLGFEYAERVYHRFRRRRWIRTRLLKDGNKGREVELAKKGDDYGWEYAVKFGRPTHHRMHPEDGFRRRRWHNEMVPVGAGDKGDSRLFAKLAMRVKQIKEAESGTSRDSDVESGVMIADIPPRAFVVYDKVQRWELRVYILQGRDIFPATRHGNSSSFVRVVFMNRCQQTQVVPDVINPIWNQTLIFTKVLITGTTALIRKQPPYIDVEVFHDQQGLVPVFLGRFLARPTVCLGSEISDRTVQRDEVRWYPCEIGEGKIRGDVLMALELYESDNAAFLPAYPFEKNRKEMETAIAEKTVPVPAPLYVVPKEIRPEYENVDVDFLCWGVRNLRRYQLLSVRRPFVEVSVSNQVGRSESLKDVKKNPNFQDPVLRLENVLLPKRIALAAPITLSLFDTRRFGRKPLIGVCLVKDFRKYVMETPKMNESERGSELGLFDKQMVETALLNDMGSRFDSSVEKPKRPEADTDFSGSHPDLDWWSKYYASVGDRTKSVGYLEGGYEPIEVLEIPLEDVPHYNGFNDFCDTFKFYKVAKGKKGDPEYREEVGEVKGRLFVYRKPEENRDEGSTRHTPLPPLKSLIPGIEYCGPTECTLRVYVIRADDLASVRRSGKADPYLEVKIGRRKKMKARKRARWDTLNPIFGELFEFHRVVLPQDKTLKVTVKDRRRITADEEIGSTVVDLENRLLTKWRATVGLPSEFNVRGPYVWRDQKTPMQILRAYCKVHKFPRPRLLLADQSSPMRIQLGDDSRYGFDLESLENAAGRDVTPRNTDLGEPHQRLALHVLRRLALVPEHVETRPLYNSVNINTEQGRLQMWVDIFPSDKGAIPPATDVSPRQPQPFQLRVVVWNVRDAILERVSFGEKSVDLYVKCYMNGFGKGKKTDVNYRSLDGSGSFNWRMVFNFDFDPWEKSVVLRTRRFFWQRKREERLEPELVVELWDNHKFGRDKYLGQMRLNLLRCEEGQLEDDMMTNVKRRVRRWFCRKKSFGDESIDQNAEKVYIPTQRRVSLFEQKQTKGWWPAMRGGGGKGREVTGKIQLEMNLMNRATAEKNKVGIGRKEPNMDPYLPKPDRPVMDRHWLTSRIKGLYTRIWKKGKWWILLFVVLVLIALVIVAVIWHMPELINEHA